MLAGIVTSATATSLDAADGVITTARRHAPDLPIWVLTAEGVPGADGLPETEGGAVANPAAVTVAPVGDVIGDVGVAVTETLGHDDQVAFALPFLLERLTAEVGPILYVSPGCLLTDRPTEIAELLVDHPLALAARSTPSYTHSTTPHLVEMTLGRGQLSHRVFGIRSGTEAMLDDWKSTMVESFFDVMQRRPTDFVGSVFAAAAGRPLATIGGERTLMNWTDYAAVESGRAVGRRPALVVADELWTLGRRQAEADGDAEVEWQLLADKVHDSRPLGALVEVVTS
ncbi:MAG: hypothetical protein AAFN30_01960, partial [Actinomycetota bacterium]